MKQGRQALLYTASSAASWVVDTGMFYLLKLLLSSALGAFAAPVCNVGARFVSWLVNFGLNNRLVFRSSLPAGAAFWRYMCLAVPQLAASTLLLTLFVRLLHAESAGGSTAVKIAVDSALFVASFFIQKYWVFADRKERKDA